MEIETRATAPVEPLFPNRMTLLDIARAMRPGDPRGACERTARMAMDRLRVPFIKMAGCRWYDRETVRKALLASEVNREPPKRGRPTREAMIQRRALSTSP
jgi:hypothetical protein